MQAVGAEFNGLRRVLLAVSGGVDSMVLLDAAAALPRRQRPALLVASFDHGTGAPARRAVEIVRRRAKDLGLNFTTARARSPVHTEHEWRMARWAFLRGTAADFRAPIATAHTLDDQIETVFMRILRESDRAGWPALYADSEIVRPFLRLRTPEAATNTPTLHRCPICRRTRRTPIAGICEIASDTTFFRPSCAESTGISRRAAGTDSRKPPSGGARSRRSPEQMEAEPEEDGSLRMQALEPGRLRCRFAARAVAAMAARASVVMDRRGTHRAAEFTTKRIDGRHNSALRRIESLDAP